LILEHGADDFNEAAKRLGKLESELARFETGRSQ
jgi:hypothetical protein